METQEQTHEFGVDETLRLNTWIFEAVRPYINGRSLEIGSGHGSFTKLLVQANMPIHLSDPLRSNRDALRTSFAKFSNVRSVHDIDINNPDADFRQLKGAFHTVIAINVVENGYYNESAILNMQQLLKPHANLIIIVPAYTSLYFGLEASLDEWKIFNQQNISKLLNNRLELRKLRYLNFRYPPQNSAHNNVGLSTLLVARPNQ